MAGIMAILYLMGWAVNDAVHTTGAICIVLNVIGLIALAVGLAYDASETALKNATIMAICNFVPSMVLAIFCLSADFPQAIVGYAAVYAVSTFGTFVGRVVS